MTPVYDLSQSASPFPFVDLNEDQHLQHFTDLVPHQAAAASSPHDHYVTFSQDQREKQYSPESHQTHHKVDTYDLEGGSSDHHAMSSSSTSAPVTNNSGNNDGSMRWMATKVRLQIRKIVNSSTNDHHHPGKSSIVVGENIEEFIATDIVRVCSDCNTTKTPLWRSGPRGPKSLCNACGIRQRKARRAMAEAARANGTDMGATSSTTYNKVHKKKKKSLTSYVDTQKRKLQENNIVNASTSSPDQDNNGINKRINKFEEFTISLSKNSAFRRVFPRDEEEAAILLMALSCGLVHG